MDSEKYRHIFGIVLRDLRKKKNYSQEKLALDCELDRTFISMIERGLRQPSLSTIVKIAEVLKVKPSKLLIETEKNYTKTTD